MVFTDICFNEDQANGIWEIPIGTAPGTPVSPGISISDALTAIKAQTDQFVFTVANQVDANALSGGLTASSVRSALGLSSADLDTQLDAILASSESGLTASELRTALGMSSANLDTQLGAINSKTTNLPSDPADASVISSSFDSVAALATAIKAVTDQIRFTVANQVDSNTLTSDLSVSDIWSRVIEAGFTAEEILRLMAAVLLGSSSGFPDSPVFVGLDETTDRVTATVDADGNRSAIVLDED